jgi:hypothetical protein
LKQDKKRIEKGGLQATEEQWEKVSKERLKALIATILQRVKDLVAAKGGSTKWWSNSYNIEQTNGILRLQVWRKCVDSNIETVFVWDSIVNLFQVFHAKSTPTFPDLRSALGTCFWYMGPPPSTSLKPILLWVSPLVEQNSNYRCSLVKFTVGGVVLAFYLVLRQQATFGASCDLQRGN